MSAQKILIVALSGLIVGTAIGLLTAPAKGKETRQKISDSADEMKKKLRRLRGQAIDELDELKSLLEDEVDGLKDDVRNKFLKLIDASKKKYNHVREEAKSL